MTLTNAMTLKNYLHLSEESEFLVASKAERTAFLRTLVENRTLVTVYDPPHDAMMMSMLVAAEPADNRIFLDAPVDSPNVERFLSLTAWHLVAFPDNIRLQMVAAAPRRVVYQSKPTFMLEFPARMWRVQRREFHRLDVPLSAPVRLHMPWSGARLPLQVRNMSLAGLCIAGEFPVQANIREGQHLNGCDLQFPVGAQTVSITADLEIRSCHPAAQGALAARTAGCRFLSPFPPSSQKLFQRYLNALECDYLARRRQAR
ncbi:MAG: flagellar brake protein [Betaproteobacteria bacterium]|nr:flagellar brake protein [Betaproteobacteria bacterium]